MSQEPGNLEPYLEGCGTTPSTPPTDLKITKLRHKYGESPIVLTTAVHPIYVPKD